MNVKKKGFIYGRDIGRWDYWEVETSTGAYYVQETDSKPNVLRESGYHTLLGQSYVFVSDHEAAQVVNEMRQNGFAIERWWLLPVEAGVNDDR